ncbi:MAG TPA: hypothetical protein VIH04_07880 [Nitrosarchaeum sp.]
MPNCSERTCKKVAIKEVTIHAESPATDKKYKIWIFVCSKHFEEEKKVGNIIDVIKTFRPRLQSFSSGG